MTRFALPLVTVSCLFVLTSLAGAPPNLERTLEAQRQLVADEPYSSEARNDLGNLLLLAGRDGEAEEAYRRAVELDGDNRAARFNLGLLLQQDGRLEEAQTELTQLIEIAPYHAWAHYQLGVMFEARGDRSRAIEHYARAFAYDPSLSFASNNPHIIDNRLSTEALLRSQRYQIPQAAQVPRQYGDADRIADLMLDLEEAEAEGTSEAAESEAAGSEAAEPPAATGERAPEVEDHRQWQGPDEGDEGWEDEGREEDEEDEGDEEDENGGDRTVTWVDIPGRSSGDAPAATNQAVTPQEELDAQRAAAEARRKARERFYADRSRLTGEAPSSGAQGSGASGSSTEPQSTTRSRVAPSRLRYRPGTVSTGRLELKLLPEEPAERRAELGAGARG